MQYRIGSKVVYPMHGAGVIESIEEREIMGEKQMYYILRIPVGDMKVMIPMRTADEIGLRDVIDSAGADRVLEEFKRCPVEIETNWNKRHRENVSRIKSRGLSTGERKMLSNAKQILVSELVVAKSSNQQAIEALLEELLAIEKS